MRSLFIIFFVFVLFHDANAEFAINNQTPQGVQVENNYNSNSSYNNNSNSNSYDSSQYLQQNNYNANNFEQPQNLVRNQNFCQAFNRGEKLRFYYSIGTSSLSVRLALNYLGINYISIPVDLKSTLLIAMAN